MGKSVEELMAKVRKKDPGKLHKLIDGTLRKINGGWAPGTLTWLRENQPDQLLKMKELEDAVNQAMQEGNASGLRQHLTQYEELLLSAVGSYRDSLN